MVQIRKILVCIQFNESCKTVVPYACAVAERFGAELHVLHVLEASPEPDVAVLPPDEASFASGGEDLVLAGIIPPKWEERLICRRVVTFGVPWIEITRYAWQHDIDVIVVGASRHSVLSRWLRGSVTDQVVHHAPCPIFVISPTERRFPLV
jgi:nucleotide-binding universal stress UspA family protein